MYTEIIDGKRKTIREDIKEISLESLVIEIGFKKLGEVLYIIGESMEKGVLLELYGKEKIIRVGKGEYDYNKMEVRIGALIMGDANINYMITHMLEEIRIEWGKRVK
jgi:hypothetical protein